MSMTAAADTATHRDRLIDLMCDSRAEDECHGLHSASCHAAPPAAAALVGPTRMLSSASQRATSTATGTCEDAAAEADMKLAMSGGVMNVFIVMMLTCRR